MEFPDLPRAYRSFKERDGRIAHARAYHEPVTSSLNWRGPEWTSPIALEFETKVMTSQGALGVARIPLGTVVEPEDLGLLLQKPWLSLYGFLHHTNHVVDHDETVRLMFGVNQWRFDCVEIIAKARCWPAIPGVTIPIKDTTL